MKSADVKVEDRNPMPPVRGKIFIQVAKDVKVARIAMEEEVPEVVVINEVGVADVNQCLNGLKTAAWLVGPEMRIVLKENDGLRLLDEFKGLPDNVEIKSLRIRL